MKKNINVFSKVALCYRNSHARFEKDSMILTRLNYQFMIYVVGKRTHPVCLKAAL